MLILLSQNEQGISALDLQKHIFPSGSSSMKSTFPWMQRHYVNYYKGEQLYETNRRETALTHPRIRGVSDSMPRRCGRQTTRVNHPAETPKQYWRISLYYPFLDNLITNLNHVSLNRKTASMHSIYCPVL